MADDDVLMDVFVNVEPKGVPEAEKALNDFVARVKGTFSDFTQPIKIAPIDTKSIKSLSAEITNVQNQIKKPVRLKVDEEGLKRGSRAFGNLSNNAYQLGQAFEDAAVGFQLNGISGAVRGAANNVAFLIANLQQSGTLTQFLGAKTAGLIGLYAGIGSALAILVLPKLVEWGQAMDDIELRSRKVADVFEQEFRDAKFQVSLELDAQAAVKAVRDAENSLAALEEVIRQAEDAEKLKFQISATLSTASRGDTIRAVENLVGDLQDVLSDRLRDVSKDIILAGVDLGPGIILPADPAQIRVVTNLQNAMETFNVASKQAFENSKRGIVDIGSIQSARDALRFLIEGFEELKKSSTLSSDDAEKFKASLEAARDKFTEINEEAQKLQSKQESLLKSGLDALGLFSELSAEYKFLDSVNDGRLKKEDRILFDLQQQSIELQKQAAQARELFGKNPVLEQRIDEAEAVLKKQQEIDLTAEILDIERQIAEERKEASKRADDAAKRRLELQQRLGEEEIRGQQKIANAVGALEEEKEAQASERQQKAIQDRIEQLQKLDKQSTSFGAGDTRAQIFGDNVKSEIERLQEELKTLREDEAKKENKERLQELESRIIQERAEAQKRIEDLRKDVEEARQDEIDALNENADEINKLVQQLRSLQAAMSDILLNRDPLMDPAERAKVMEQEKQLEMDVNRAVGGDFAPEDERKAPLFLPEDEIRGIGDAQAEANAAAMDNLDFKSSSLETLTQQTNRLLLALNDGVSRLDVTARLA
jgi:hypothetical protein